MKLRLLIALTMATLGAAALAAPAPWYKWRSKLGDIEVCAQTSPGEGWEKIPHPYKNARCR